MTINLYKRYVTPTNTPTSSISRRVVIPDDDAIIWALNDVLRMLCSESVWDDSGGLSTLDMHSLMAEVLLSFKDIDEGPDNMGTGATHYNWAGLRPLTDDWVIEHRSEGYMTLKLADNGGAYIPIAPGDYDFRLIYHKRSSLNTTSLIFRANSTYLFDMDLQNDGTQLQDRIHYIDGSGTCPDGSTHLRLEQSVNNLYAHLIALQIRVD